ncbi:MAG TPA: ferritin-like domain-containing protein [Phycisphaerae bacterium]|nr:ferritin-like domain-containing protein [Phycisphaerae bacterium]
MMEDQMPEGRPTYDDDVADLLRRALTLESGNLLSSLGDAHPFLSWRDAAALADFQRMHQDEAAHQRDLSAALLRRGVTPPPVRRNPRAAGLHYLEVRYVLGALRADKRRLIGEYRGLEEGCQDACRDLLTRIRRDHEEHLKTLDAWTARPVSN